MDSEKLLLIEFKKVHLCEARRQRYRTHIKDTENQKYDRDLQDCNPIRHILESADDAEQE